MSGVFDQQGLRLQLLGALAVAGCGFAFPVNSDVEIRKKFSVASYWPLRYRLAVKKIIPFSSSQGGGQNVSTIVLPLLSFATTCPRRRQDVGERTP